MKNMSEHDSIGASADPPAPPASMSADDVDGARRQATELVRGVRDASGSRQLAVIDELTTVGLMSQRNAGVQLELVKTRLGTFVAEGGASRAVATDLIDLRSALGRIDPEVERRTLRSRIAAALPVLRKNALVRSLTRIALRYEPVSKQVIAIETKLREGRAMLARDNVELRRLYEDVEAQHAVVERQTFLGELLLRELLDLDRGSFTPAEQDRIGAAVHDVAARVQDLRTVQEVHTQYFLSIELTRQNNTRLGQAVERTLALATNVVTVGLAIQAALARQRQVKEATERTRQFLGEVIAHNAAAIRRQTEEIGDLYNEPVVAMEKLTQAHKDLVAALDSASRLRDEGIDAARRNIQQLTGMTRELAGRVQGIDDGDSAVRS
jgi:hypothetical protein